jgi:hypothetical protein
MTNEKRIAIERRIAKAVAKDLIAAGFQVTVNDGEEDVLERSTNVLAILGAMFSTDWDYLRVYLPGKRPVQGYVHIVYGNDGYDVVSDYTTNLEDVLKASTALADKLETEAS